MRVATVDDAFVRMLRKPTWQHLHRVRQLLLVSAHYRPDAPEWTELQAAFAQQDYAAVLRDAGQLRVGFCACPRWHYVVGVSALEMGDTSLATSERQAVRACMQALLTSGSGEADAPFVVTYPTDAYDILQALGEEPRKQQLVEVTQPSDSCRRWHDQLTSHSGTTWSFDVTDLLAAYGKDSDAACKEVASVAELAPTIGERHDRTVRTADRSRRRRDQPTA